MSSFIGGFSSAPGVLRALKGGGQREAKGWWPKGGEREAADTLKVRYSVTLQVRLYGYTYNKVILMAVLIVRRILG